MALSLDSRSVLRAIADHPDAFPAIQGDVDEFARKALGKQIKHKGTDLALARALVRSTGHEAFATILDSLAPNETAALLKKLDGFNPLVKGDDARSVRGTIDNLVMGSVEPISKPEKPIKATALKKTPSKSTAKPKIGDILESKVHAGAPRPTKSKKAS